MTMHLMNSALQALPCHEEPIPSCHSGERKMPGQTLISAHRLLANAAVLGNANAVSASAAGLHTKSFWCVAGAARGECSCRAGGEARADLPEEQQVWPGRVAGHLCPYSDILEGVGHQRYRPRVVRRAKPALTLESMKNFHTQMPHLSPHESCSQAA